MDDDDRPSDESSDPEDPSQSVESGGSPAPDEGEPATTDEDAVDGDGDEGAGANGDTGVEDTGIEAAAGEADGGGPDDGTDLGADESETVDGDADDSGEDRDDHDDSDSDEDAEDSDEDGDAEDSDDSDPDVTGDGGTSPAVDVGDVGGIQGPETDEEMPLAEHIEEMMRRLAVVFLFGGLATLVAVTESAELINYFWGYHIPAPLENRPRLYAPLELPLTRLKVAGLAGVVVGLPAFVYQTYRFMKPGLYENERRYYLAAVPTSLVLGGIGIAFAHFLVLPAIFSYFTTYTSDAATIAFGLAETFNLIVIMLAFMAIVFQIPLFIMLAIMMNLVTRQWLEDKRLIFWGSFLGIAFLFSPDPTGMAPIIVTLTMIVLFEGTLAILRWTGN
ncbi:MFS transporter [Halorubrum sp. 48-1-W]|uniref:twin-arginine translocase subunit TatC n=1 Tax=Halorubrum sp. 48-1-W TaxID=2249761 RepID=UPI000DCE9417|nr:twin-arginine translocase subunit TatC [Halorubrum sp. 48-1-W]RAW44418.1 MFS transporter [Halorubrum sp. 48-1-W]